MSTPRIPFPLLGLAVFGAGLAVTTGMSHPSGEPGVPSSLGLDGKTEAALRTLAEEMQRRFHDRNDQDFGFSRIVRPATRFHGYDPLLRKFERGLRSRIVPGKSSAAPNRIEIEDPELGWVGRASLKPLLRPENERERQAVAALRESHVDVALYTFGIIGIEGLPARSKGPGYLRQLTSTAPPAESLAKYAQQAWRTKSDQSIIDGPDGWYLMAHRVIADDQTCVGCHGGLQDGRLRLRAQAQAPTGGGVDSIPQIKQGDAVGLLVIAVRPRSAR